MTASPNPARPGEIVTYTITVANRGTVALSGVELNVTLPDKMETYFAALRAYGPGDVLGWTGTIGAGQNWTVTMQPRLEGFIPDGTIIQNVATVSSSNGQSATDTATIMIDATPVVGVQVEEDQDPVQPGGRLNYRLTFANRTTVNATAVELRMRLPAGVTFVSASNGGIENNGEVRWTLGTVSAGQSGLRQLTVTVGAGLAAGTLLNGEASTHDAAQPQSTGRSRAITTVQVAPPLAVTMTASPNPARPGDIVTYTMTVANRGTVALAGVELNVTLPDKMETYFAALRAYGPGDVVDWTGTIGAGQNWIVTMQPRLEGFIPDGTIIQNVATVSSSNGQSATSHLTVQIGNNWPTIDAIPPHEIAVASPLVLTISATDADMPNQTLIFSLDPGAPTGASIDSRTGVFSWTPSPAQGRSTNSITVRVTDSSSQRLSVTQTFTVIVIEANILSPIQDRTLDEGGLLTFTVALTNSSSAIPPVTYSLESTSPTSAVLNPNTGVLFWRTTEADGPSTNTFTVRVKDSGSAPATAARTFKVVINEINRPPTLASVERRTIATGATLSFRISAADEDLPANSLTYSLEAGAPTGAVINPTTGVFTWTPGAVSSLTTNSITARVTDNGSPLLSDTQSFLVIVISTPPLGLEAFILPTGQVQITMTNTLIGRTYFMEVSNNLKDWSVLTNFVGSAATSQVLDIISSSQRFYRAVSP